MAGLVPAIHALLLRFRKKDVDARDKRGHDGEKVIQANRKPLQGAPS
jgi:hypothetical protein